MIRLIALAAIVLAFAATCFVSPYGFWMTDSPAVEKVAELPDSAVPPDMDRRIRFKATQIAINRPDLPFEPSRVALGRQFRTFSALALPFAAYDDKGYVIYAESRKRLQIIELDDAGLAALSATVGRDLTAGYTWKWWSYLWGWGFVLALAIWLVFQFAHEAKVRRLENEAED